MRIEEESLIATMRYLTPKNSFWLKRISILFVFILSDYAVTLVLCKAPAEEGNFLARGFMEAYGIPLGLTFFDFVANFPIYILLCFNSHIINLPPKLTRITEASVDIVFAWFIAGLHFNGAASWFWFTSDIVRQSVGASLYLLVVFMILWRRHR